MSTQIRVTNKRGLPGAVGYITPQVGMPTNLGYVTAYTDPFVTIGAGHGQDDLPDFGAGSVSGFYRVYADQLMMYSGDAAAYGWPNGANCVVLGHDRGINAGGAPQAAFLQGFVYETGGSASLPNSVVPPSGQRPDVLV